MSAAVRLLSESGQDVWQIENMPETPHCGGAGWKGRGHSSLPWGVVAVHEVGKCFLPFKYSALS